MPPSSSSWPNGRRRRRSSPGRPRCAPPRSIGLPPPGCPTCAVSLNTAFMTGGAVIQVRKGAGIERPIHLAHAFSGTSAAATYPRSVVIVEPGARVMLIESFEGPDVDYQVNTVLQVFAGEGAH